MYYLTEGKINTSKTVKLAVETAMQRGINHIVIASCSGETARLLKNLTDIQVVCVTHVNGFEEEGKNEMPEEVRQELTEAGMKVLTTTHVLSGAERGISRSFGGAYPVEIIAHTLRMLGQGVKVCVEVSIMALDAGLIPYGEPVIAIGGNCEGADTAVMIKPSHASSIFKTRIMEIVCKPQ
ncbi:MAG: hypothetical protein N2484_00405 [Clostridia bacterium]|nr:hypothetical protein [Clostridia bacterium]